MLARQTPASPDDSRRPIGASSSERERLELRRPTRPCRSSAPAYWYPIYAFIRRKGNGADQALDLTQELFRPLARKRQHRRCEPWQGPLPRRSAHRLPALLDRPVPSNDCSRLRTPGRLDRRPRGGGPLSLRAGRYAHARPPVRPRLGADLLDRVLDLLAREYAGEGAFRGVRPLKVRAHSGARGLVPVATLAAELGKTEEAVNMAVHRLRKRYREILEEQIAATLDDPSEIRGRNSVAV